MPGVLMMKGYSFMEKKIQSYLEGKLPENEQAALLEWLREEEHKQTFDSEKARWWKERKLSREGRIADLGQVRLRERLKEKQQLKRSARLLNWYRYAAIALLVMGLSGAAFVYNNYFNTELQLTQIHTELGQMSTVILPDGSKIWVNADTKLTYNNQYGIQNRAIQVQGEAYFEVARNLKDPFIVDLGAIQVKVTGTQFGISNYDDLNEMNVVLEEGSVEIQSASDELIVKLKPEELAVFNKKTNTIHTMKVKSAHYTSWKDGILNIFELPLDQLVVKLERRYNQKFEVDPLVKDLPYTFSIEGESLAEVIHLIERISPVKAQQEGNVIKFKYMKH
jgi:ferric-dicitrate binding protein FerR (iron transport regulator)